jgi:hypothetical protein
MEVSHGSEQRRGEGLRPPRRDRSGHQTTPELGFDAVMAGGLSALDAGLYSIGVSKNSIMEYETALKSDKFLVIAHGTADEMAKAKSILETTRAAQVAAHRG